MHLVLIGLSHKTAPVDIREKLSISKAHLLAALDCLMAVDGVCECVILSTCNRTEIYAYAESRTADQALIEQIGEFCGVDPAEFVPHTYTRAGHKAAEHLFLVSPGMDSIALGETQILGQVKDAYAAAVQAKTVGPVLNVLFQQATAVAKRVLTETGISRGSYSIGSAAARLARSVFGNLDSSTLLVVGAGKVAELTLSHLASLGVKKLMVANRTANNAAELVARFKGEVASFDDLATELAKADIVISSTGAAGCVIDRNMVSSAMRVRRGRPMFIIDLAVPRDVEESVAEVSDVFLYNVDDLHAVVDANDVSRKAEIGKVEAIVAEEVAKFQLWFRTQDAVPVITALREKFERIRAAEMEKLTRKLDHLSPEDLQSINMAMGSVVNKICHEPMIQIKECAVGPHASARLDAVCEVFGLCPSEVTSAQKRPRRSVKHVHSVR